MNSPSSQTGRATKGVPRFVLTEVLHGTTIAVAIVSAPPGPSAAPKPHHLTPKGQRFSLKFWGKFLPETGEKGTSHLAQLVSFLLHPVL